MKKSVDPVFSASLLAANGARLGEEAHAMVAAGVERLHLDIMDHHFVPNLTFGPWLCQALRDEGIVVPFDVHLMVQPVDDLIVAFAKAGATEITFHPEASQDVHRSLEWVRDHGCAVGLALNPDKGLSHLPVPLSALDHVLLMSVQPGWGGQAFKPETLEKAQSLRTMADTEGVPLSIGMDGGLGAECLADVVAAGVDRLVVGTSLFGASDYAVRLQQLRALC